MIPNIGPVEILIVLVIALVVFGPKRLPELGSALGKGIRGFGTGLKGADDESLPAPESNQTRTATVEPVIRSAAPEVAQGPTPDVWPESVSAASSVAADK